MVSSISRQKLQIYMKSIFTKRFHVAVWLAIIASYFVSRLSNLDIFPIFTDEAIYVRWSQIGSFDAAWRFIPLTDGKPPLYHWLVMITVRIFQDPLLAGRFVSVLAGFANLLLISALAQVLFGNKRISLITAIFYLLSPFALVYNRLAIVDSLLTTFSLSSLLLTAVLAKRQRLDIALLLGASIGAGLLTKASGLFFLIFTPFTLLLFDFNKPKPHKRLLHWLGLITLSAFISQLIYSILRLSEFFYRIGQKNTEFIISISDFLQSPFTLTWGNLKSLIIWQIGYLTIPIFLLVLTAFTTTKHLRQKLVLLAYYLAPLIIIASFNKIIFPRFLLFSSPFLLILAATGFYRLTHTLNHRYLKSAIFLLAIFIPFSTCYFLITHPKLAQIPQADRDQYLDSWPAGWGITQTVDHLRQIADTAPIYVGTQGTFGLMPYAIEIYLQAHPNVEIHSFWPVEYIPPEVLAAAQQKTTYFIYNELEDIPPQDNLELVLEFEKRRGDEIRHMRLFRVHPK